MTDTIQIPPRGQFRRKQNRKWPTLKVGESVEIPTPDVTHARRDFMRRAHSAYRSRGQKITTRWTDAGIRIWAIE